MATRKKAAKQKGETIEPVETVEETAAVETAEAQESPPAELTPIEQAPNVIYRPSRVYRYEAEREVGGKKKTVKRLVDKPTEIDPEGQDTVPPKSPVVIGKDSIPVPDAETQLKGFYSPFAARLVSAINQYKFLKPLGTK